MSAQIGSVAHTLHMSAGSQVWIFFCIINIIKIIIQYKNVDIYLVYSGQAMDIGAPAILFLIDAWEGHLTPPEAAGIADKVICRLWYCTD